MKLYAVQNVCRALKAPLFEITRGTECVMRPQELYAVQSGGCALGPWLDFDQFKR